MAINRIGRVPSIQQAVITLKKSAQRVEWVKELLSHAAFYGTVAAGVLGYHKDSVATAIVAVVWFLFCLKLSFALACRLEVIEEAEHEREKDWFRKTAGMTRSVVRSELDRTTTSNKGRTDWD